jgi:hypothetical protein
MGAPQAPEVVSLPTADERRKMEAAGQLPVERNYGEKASGLLGWRLIATWLA